MTLRPALARLERGFRRMWAWWTVAFAQNPLQRRRRVTEGQVDTARETRVMLEIMADATAAGPDMTDDQRLLLAQALPGMRARESRLLEIPNRSSIEENELLMIRREMARIEGRDEAPQIVPRHGGARAQGFLGMAAANPLMAILMSPATWVAVAFAVPAAWGGFHKARGDRLERQRNEARAELAATERELVQASAERDLLADAVNAATQQSAQAAETIEAERARRLRAEREARRIRDAMEQARAGNSVDYGFGGMRDDRQTEGPAGPGSGDAAGSRSR